MQDYELEMSNNPEQTFAYEIFKNATENGNIINLIVTGPAGTGKSKVLNELINSIEETGNLLVGAYTGMAASNVNGELICNRLNLTPSSDRRRKERKDGNLNISKNMEINLKRDNSHLKHLFVDEYAMVCKNFIF